MRTPSGVYDKTLLEDEPFSSGFLMLGSSGSRRSRKHEINSFLDSMAAGFKGDEVVAADAWARLAFKSSPSEGKKHRVRPGPKTRQAFVIFYWNLSEHNPNRNDDSAANFLRQERSKRGFDYTPVEFAVAATTNRTTISKRKLRLSCHIINGTKREILSAKSRLGSSIRAKNTKNGGAGFEGAQTLSDRFTGPLKISTTFQTSSPMSQKTSSPSSVSLSLQGKLQVGTTLELLESAQQIVILPPNKQRIAMEFSLPKRDVLADSCLVNEPTVRHEKDDIVMSSLRMSTENMDIDPFSSTTLSSPPADDIQPEIMLETAIDEDLSIPHISGLNLSESGSEERNDILTYNNSLKNPNLRVDVVKPPLPRYPPIWAQSRQEVCESFDWFRSYQGGVYFTNDHAKGYLLSAFSSMHDTFEHDGRLIISHGGGKAESAHSRQGKSTTRAADDQLAQDKSIRALLTNYREYRPLVLLIDDKYALFPYDLRPKGITYAVLGFYTISHAWAEYHPAENMRGRVVRYKFAFQWCDGQGQPWWTAQAEEGSPSVSSTGDLKSSVSSTGDLKSSVSSTGDLKSTKITRTRLTTRIPFAVDDVYAACPTCSKKSPKVYELAWVCLNPACSSFWFDTESSGRPSYNLTYDSKFLQLSKPYLLPLNLRDICPVHPEISQGSIGTTYAFTRGLHCRNCGRLSCRSKWEHWECMYCHVKFSFLLRGLPGKLRTPEEFWNEDLPSSFLDHCIQPSSGIWKGSSSLFTIGSAMARVQTFVLPDASGCIHHIQATTPRGNKDADIIFKEYQEHALAGTLKFRRWPMRAASRGPLLTNYFSQNCRYIAAGEPYQYVGGTANSVPFSETSSAVIKARDLIQLRIRQALGIHSEFNEVLSAAYMERQKMAFHSDSERGLGPMVAGLSLGSPALMHFRVNHKYLREEELENNSIALTILLRHGDILVMDGAGIQVRYEHTVVPTNFRIAATARNIAVSTKLEVDDFMHRS
ncbi:hypothetical protein J132_04959 [Termitomyces sp. J132]|nr:hypothetical protein J132_04959 [Termitomyces sp. J132]